jgi:hypothetical protein
MRALLLILLASLLAVLVWPRPLRADVPPPNSAQCNGKNAGDTCTTDDGKSGACASSTCSKLDYSDGTPPGTKTYPCLLCNAGPAPTTTTTTTSSASSSATPSEGGSGCNVGFAARAAGAGGIALIVPAIVLFSRRRRARR